MDHKIYLYNTLSKQKELFIPYDRNHIKLYVCGPTVYNYPHVGNARAVVVYDILFKLLKACYSNITYVRNITDVDDKIIAAAKEKGKSIASITDYYTYIFESNMQALGADTPTYQPKATDHIKDMIQLIEVLIKRQHAYVTEDGSVYFDITSYKDYGKLSGKKVEDLIAGSRIEIEQSKHHPGDFALWKPDNEQFWPSPWGNGRPGWHIECSAMSYAFLGENFDIHGGGIDLQFPHHENEIAQSCCAFPNSHFAKYWIHNGFLTVEGEKMSKSLGNIVTVQQLLEEKIPGEVIRFVLLSTHYRKPINWTREILKESKISLDRFYRAIHGVEYKEEEEYINPQILAALSDDLNTPQAISVMHELVNRINTTYDENKKFLLQKQLKYTANLLLGILNKPDWFKTVGDETYINNLITQRLKERHDKNYAHADKIRKELENIGVILEDRDDGTTKWYVKN